MKVGNTIKEAGDSVESAVETGRRIVHGDHYILVFILILMTVLASAFVGDGPLGLIVTLLLQTTTLLVALRTSDAGPKSQMIAGVVSALTIAGVTIALLTGNEGIAKLAYAASMVVLVAVTPIAIVRRLLQHPIVNMTTVTGAANIYLLFGLFWSAVYSFIGAATQVGTQTPAEAFFISATQRTPIGSDFIYYSYVTLTTVGYGDLTAASQIGRMISVTEALVGQLYLVIVVSVLVANVGRIRPEKRLELAGQPDSPDAEAPATANP